jgi:hypothetical protein
MNVDPRKHLCFGFNAMTCTIPYFNTKALPTLGRQS